ncbi:helix-turn-helix transcriptional regulator [Chengkuizengella axinellae]|uniref:YafY family protein n=1 Tax=Chengkuizengella axinellae TaxID=3064388 RepID=A0ABT9IZW7_9BACL|nr:YafY family protein [Chengkuizengella sp. 2205SS18-9]MDP5274915.1 YafY family protein [Chengkuizengella sp. 2205SS18-9]
MKIDRLIAILMILMNTNKTTAVILAEKFEVSVRTIYRDLDTLLVAGIPVMTAQGLNGGIYIDEAFKLDKQYFSLKEITHLLVGLKGIESAMDDHGLKAALEKVKSLVPEEVSDEFNDAMGQVSIDLLSWIGHSEIKEKLKKIKYGLSKSVVIWFNYINRRNKPSSRSVEPYRLLLKESAWYLEGYCLEKSDFRMFKLSRMIELKVTDQTFVKREFIPQRNDVNGWVKNQMMLIDVEFDYSILERMVERCGEKNIEKIGVTTYKAKMPFTDNAHSYNSLLSFGKNIRCVGPEKIRAKLLEHIESIKKMYYD